MLPVVQHRGTRNHRDYRPDTEVNLLRHLGSPADAFSGGLGVVLARRGLPGVF